MAPSSSTGRCLYDVLGLSRDCSIEEIRSAYKKLALRLHPDKVSQSSGGSIDHAHATAVFQELQHAYDVLRDPKERSWYDSHRSQILFASGKGEKTGDGSFANSFSSFFSKFSSSRSPMDDIGDIFSFFSASAYSGFSDSGNGFYKVYGDLFGKIHANEVRFAREVDLDEDLEPAPLLGNLNSSFEQWNAFYKYWLGFSTVIDFSWADLYDPREGANRRARREMEELNSKARKKMRREYNDTVRSLAAFVKKRDKRVVEVLRKKKAEEEVRKEEQRRKKEEERKKKEEKARQWAEVDEEDDDDGILEDDWFGSAANGKKKDVGGEQELYCVVCSKKFKSEKQWKNHEQSKKHREKVAELRESLQDDDDDDDDGGDSNGGDDHVGNDIDADFDYVEEATDGSDEKSEVVEEIREKLEEGFGLGEDEDDETVILEAMISKHKSKKAANGEEPVNGFHPAEPIEDEGESSSMEYNPRRKGRKKRASKNGNPSKPDGNANKNLDGDDDEKGQVDKHQPPIKVDHQKNQQPARRQHDGRSSVDKNADAAEGKMPNKGKKQKGSSKAANNMCGTCGESFDSRNKLFAHLGETGHAMLKTR
ncbi:DNAJ heat shock N-terminal domain-containing protein [Wolffia australiana]